MNNYCLLWLLLPALGCARLPAALPLPRKCLHLLRPLNLHGCRNGREALV